MSSEWSNGRNVGVAISHDENGSEWRIATGDWSNEGCLLERLSAATKTATTKTAAISDWRTVRANGGSP
ncbi:MAG: hypothetical protein ACO2PK_04515 [Armatimonadota bacterium]